MVGFIGSGSISGIPPLVIMAIPFILGLVLGFFVKRLLKIAILGIIIALIASYLGFFSVNLEALKNIAEQYGPMVIHFGVLLMGILPLGLGFVVGLIVGFIFG